MTDLLKHGGMYGNKSMLNNDYIQLQLEYLNAKDIRSAVELEIADIRAKFGSKYEDAIRDVMKYVSQLEKKLISKRTFYMKKFILNPNISVGPFVFGMAREEVWKMMKDEFGTERELPTFEREYYTNPNVLLEYIKEMPERTDKLKNCFENSDWKNYAVYVHSLKSTSKMIGATNLSEKALKLEEAANREDSDFIKENHADAEDEYKDLASKMADIFGIDLSANDTEDIMEFLPQ